jgi:hypothetical protein
MPRSATDVRAGSNWPTKLARSIRDIGLLHPIVVSQDGLLLAGGRRLEACKMLGWQDIPVTIKMLGSRDPPQVSAMRKAGVEQWK